MIWLDARASTVNSLLEGGWEFVLQDSAITCFSDFMEQLVLVFLRVMIHAFWRVRTFWLEFMVGNFLLVLLLG